MGLCISAPWDMNLERHLKRISPHAQAEELAIHFGSLLQLCLPILSTPGNDLVVYVSSSGVLINKDWSYSRVLSRLRSQ